MFFIFLHVLLGYMINSSNHPLSVKQLHVFMKSDSLFPPFILFSPPDMSLSKQLKWKSSTSDEIDSFGTKSVNK